MMLPASLCKASILMEARPVAFHPPNKEDIYALDSFNFYSSVISRVKYNSTIEMQYLYLIIVMARTLYLSQTLDAPS